MAVGLGVPELKVENMTDEKAKVLILDVGRKQCGESFTMNPISGVKGSFYTEDRKRDLCTLCEEIIAERV